MGATDEFMSQLNYRSICKAKCLEKANQMCLQVSVLEFIELEGFITNLSSKNFSSIYIEAFAGVKIFVWNKDGNKIRFVVQQYGEGFDGDIDCNKLVIVFDVLINKAEFVNEFLRVINKYKSLLFEKKGKYEREYNIRFSNPMDITYINYWLKNS